MFTVCNHCSGVHKPREPRGRWLSSVAPPDRWECRILEEKDQRTNPVTGKLETTDFPLCVEKNSDGNCEGYAGFGPTISPDR